MKIIPIVAGCLATLALSCAHAQSPRFQPLPESAMNEAQLKAARELAAGQRGRLNPDGPNALLLRSPELMSRMQRVGEYLRYNSAIPQRLNEFAILITARQMDAQVEWLAHHPLAIQAGIHPATAADLQQGKRPSEMKPDEAIVYRFCKELLDTKTVSDAAFKAVLDKFGENGVIDLIAVTGYYTTLAMVLNVARQPLPGGVAPPLQPLK